MTNSKNVDCDLVLVNPGGREKIYQQLGNELSAVEPPLWCRLIGGYVQDRGFNIDIIDTEALAISSHELTNMITNRSPKLVAMVVFGHQPSASTQQMAGARDACCAIKEKNPNLPIIIIGGHVSALPEQTLEEEPVDFACNSEGPETISQLLEIIKENRKKDFSQVEGLVWRDGKKITVNPAPELIKDLDKDLHGNVWNLLPMDKYRAHNWQCFGDIESRTPYASIYTSLGCPYKCVFCCINSPFGTNRYRMRKPESVVEEVRFLHNTYGVKTFKIIDEMFVLNERHVTKICDGLSETKIKLNIWAYARIDTVKPHMLDKLRRAGIQWLALGIESGSDHVRDGAEKSFGQEDIYEIVYAIQKAGINVIGNYIFGLPDDDLVSMRKTLEMAKELNCEFANFYSAMAYPGSPLYDLAVKNDWELPESWSGYSQHSYDCTPLPTEKVSAAEVLKFRDDAFNEYFTNSHYLDTITQKFSWKTRQHLEEMTKQTLRRRLLGNAIQP